MSPTEIWLSLRHRFPGPAPRPVLAELERWFAERRTTLDDLPADAASWQTAIAESRAATHGWYRHLEEQAAVADFSSFLAEEGTMPAFVPLLRCAQARLKTTDGRQAVERNIHDELEPVSHAQLFESLAKAVHRRARPAPNDDDLLAETHLVFLFGFYCDARALIGALFATEHMLADRANRMNRGLRRLGFDENERLFMSVHAYMDEHHSADWLHRVILPEVAAGMSAERLADGVLVRLATSADYLDRLPIHPSLELPS